ncbi:MAG: NAD(P)-dependent glycerol-3-phosphate dehydrogenase [Azospirillaceae bacterium]|nr:NAD(P)-dependent glycerol-3-phosphate dehydrogenase [Azospirillaceae bacterium]
MSGAQRVAIVGGGAWGTALAQCCRRAGRDAVIWARRPETIVAINRDHGNPDCLPGIALDPAITATDDLAALAPCGVVLLVTPAQSTRTLCRQLAAILRPTVPLVICAKGIERTTGSLLTAVVAAELPSNPVAVLSGPSFAIEVARGLPTAVTLACADEAIATTLLETLGSRSFRPYGSDDVIGVQIGGAVKNVLAIACGIVQGRHLGDSARAALITRGLAEMARLGIILGARTETLMGLSGLGDLTLTCTSTQSRNMSLGAALGAGTPLSGILAARHGVTEGVHTAAALVELAEKHGVEMPIATTVDSILKQDADIDAAIAALLNRPFKAERW